MIGNDAMIPTKKTARIANNKGFTLVELIVVMAIFIVAIILSSDAFNRITLFSKQQMRASESNIQGIVGLELMRSDLEHAGYGLPWVIGFTAAFSESTDAANSLANGIDPADFNDVSMNSTATAEDVFKLPRAAQSKKSTTDERDYLVVKSTALGSGAAVKKWAYIEGVGAGSTIKVWGENDFVAGERVVTLDSRTRRLIGAGTSNFSYALAGTPLAPDAAYQPQQESDVFMVYGVSSNSDLRSPYNRVDYYVKRPADISTRCAAGTGNLYKGVMNHADGKATSYPLLDCIADLQVVYALNSDESPDGSIDEFVEESGLEDKSAKEIRAQLKEIRVYILAQEGQRDRFYSFPLNSVRVGETIGVLPPVLNVGRVFDFAARGVTDWQNYRWKVYTLVAEPRNIN